MSLPTITRGDRSGGVKPVQSQYEEARPGHRRGNSVAADTMSSAEQPKSSRKLLSPKKRQDFRSLFVKGHRRAKSTGSPQTGKEDPSLATEHNTLLADSPGTKESDEQSFKAKLGLSRIRRREKSLRLSQTGKEDTPPAIENKGGLGEESKTHRRTRSVGSPLLKQGSLKSLRDVLIPRKEETGSKIFTSEESTENLGQLEKSRDMGSSLMKQGSLMSLLGAISPNKEKTESKLSSTDESEDPQLNPSEQKRILITISPPKSPKSHWRSKSTGLSPKKPESIIKNLSLEIITTYLDNLFNQKLNKNCQDEDFILNECLIPKLTTEFIIGQLDCKWETLLIFKKNIEVFEILNYFYGQNLPTDCRLLLSHVRTKLQGSRCEDLVVMDLHNILFFLVICPYLKNQCENATLIAEIFEKLVTNESFSENESNSEYLNNILNEFRNVHRDYLLKQSC